MRGDILYMLKLKAENIKPAFSCKIFCGHGEINFVWKGDKGMHLHNVNESTYWIWYNYIQEKFLKAIVIPVLDKLAHRLEVKGG